MGHGHGFALLWKLYLGLLLAQVALSATIPGGIPPLHTSSDHFSSHSPPGASSQPGSAGISSSALGLTSSSSLDSLSSSMSSSSIRSSSTSAALTNSNSTTPTHTLPPTSSTGISPTATGPSSTQPSNTTTFSGSISSNVPQTGSPGSSNPNTAFETPPSASATPVSASVKSSHKTAIIAGVLVPILVIILGAGGFVLYKRYQRARDRREWERTHAEIADAVRQVGGPATSGATSPYSTGTWDPLDLPSRGGTGVGYGVHDGDSGEAFVDKAVGYQPVEYPPYAPFATPQTLGAMAFQSQHYADEPESHPAGSMESENSSIPIDTAHSSHDHHGL